MKIGVKLILGYLIVSCFIAIVGYISFRLEDGVRGEFDKLKEENLAIIAYIEDIKSSGLQILASTMALTFLSVQAKENGSTQPELEESKEEERSEIVAGQALYAEAFSRYEQLVSAYFSEERMFLDNIRVTGHALNVISNEMYALVQAESPLSEVFEKKEAFEAMEEAFLEAVEDALDQNEKILKKDALAEWSKRIEITTDVIMKDDVQFVHVAVSDNGVGMSPKEVARILEPFYTTKSVGEGTGLGLSISYGIIENHKGQLDIRSCKGEGTTFSVFLPTEEQVL